MITRKEVACLLMQHLCEHDYHGYSQYSRWGDGEGYCSVKVGNDIFTVAQGDRDCSSAVIDSYQSAGIMCGGATYTGNMRSCMTSTGNFVAYPYGSVDLERGDVLLNEEYHTAMYLGYGLLAEFSISETGGIDGEEGDQTDNESHLREVYNYPWDYVLRCVNTDTVGEDKTVSNLYSDVSESHWAYENIKWCQEHGIMTGYGNGKFGPEDTMTRAQMATVAKRLYDTIKTNK